MMPDPRPGGTIAALCTAPGRAAIGVLRVSGPDAAAIAERVFEPETGTRLAPRRATLGRVRDAGRGVVLDRALAIFFPGPRSYTGEDLLELHAHGGPRNLGQILELVLRAGARLAEPGEFTLWAFLAGKLDLLEAEAVADLIEADSDAAADLARAQYQGGLGSEVAALRSAALEELASLEAELDFPDEEELQERAQRQEQRDRLDGLARRAGRLACSSRWGERLLAGLRVLLVGLPNAGKSSLFNRLLGEERALVHEAPGTTRDVLEGRLDCQGLPVVLIDGAGWNEEAQGLERAGQALLDQRIDEASLAVVVVDGTQPPGPGLGPLLARLGDLDRVVARSKADLDAVASQDQVAALCPGASVIAVSARTGQGVDELWEVLGQRLGRASRPGPVATRARHRQALERAQQGLAAAASLVRDDGLLDQAAEELRAVVRALDRLLGLEYDQELLDQVFARFCIGK